VTYPLYPALDPEPQAAVPEQETTAEVPVTESKPSHKRLWATIGITTGAVIIITTLIAGVVVFHSTADRYQRKANAETTRADGLSSDLAGTKETLLKTQNDLSQTTSQLETAQANLNRSQNFSSQAAAVGAAFDQCVADVATFDQRMSTLLSAFPYGYDPTLNSFAQHVGTECGEARSAFHNLGIGAS